MLPEIKTILAKGPHTTHSLHLALMQVSGGVEVIGLVELHQRLTTLAMMQHVKRTVVTWKGDAGAGIVWWSLPEDPRLKKASSQKTVWACPGGVVSGGGGAGVRSRDPWPVLPVKSLAVRKPELPELDLEGAVLRGLKDGDCKTLTLLGRIVAGNQGKVRRLPRFEEVLATLERLQEERKVGRLGPAGDLAWFIIRSTDVAAYTRRGTSH